MPIRHVLHQTKIRHLDLSGMVCAEVSSSLREAIEIMRSQRSGCVLVTEGENLVGIFTERDLIVKVMRSDINLSSSIREFMTPQPTTLHPEDSLADAICLMNDGGLRNVPLVDQAGRHLNCLSVTDLINYLAENYPQEVLALPPNPAQEFRDPEGA